MFDNIDAKLGEHVEPKDRALILPHSLDGILVVGVKQILFGGERTPEYTVIFHQIYLLHLELHMNLKTGKKTSLEYVHVWRVSRHFH